MGLFNFKNNGSTNPPMVSEKKTLEVTNDIQPVEEPQKTAAPEIPEHIFIEQEKPKPTKMSEQPSSPSVNDLHTLYRYLEQNLEKKGYEDALINPDTSYMQENVAFIINELNLLISKIKTYYNSHLRTIDFHIDTRKRSGMLETVDELISHKATIEEEITIVTSIESDASQNKGLSQNLILGYKKGFRNGFAAITYSTVLGRKNA
ncbi:MAG: hypothetical protein JNM78_10880 [Cyclobacteriaceae bacterium]|jgi:hypothetical protein|nr:hypothetical protein [Cyclobacteriaceae bacterium]